MTTDGVEWHPAVDVGAGSMSAAGEVYRLLSKQCSSQQDQINWLKSEVLRQRSEIKRLQDKAHKPGKERS